LFENDYNIVNKKVILGLINSMMSPIFASKDKVNIIYRFLDKDLQDNYIKNYLPRLKFLDTKIYDLKDEKFETTEFMVISTKQYSACIIFDFSQSDIKNQAIFCSYLNSKKIEEILKILLPSEKFPPERRENIELNEMILNLIKFSENSLTELNINEEEKKNLENLTQNLKRDEIIAQRSRFISHEIKNQLSIIDVYAKITEKTCNGNKKIMNATEVIFKSIKNITNQLKDLKTFSEADLNIYNLKDVLIETIDFAKEMASSKEISLTAEAASDLLVILDKEKFQNVLLNLIKNAVEAFKNTDKKDKYIELTACEKEGKISLVIANNGEMIDKENQKKIFEEGYTTKKEGSGLGLYICRQNLKEQFCELNLIKSSKTVTAFEIKMNKV
ncbi:HAMP domain-containing histidine kinase, partial [bacterium]|nr:HAMP domain-containing histidine kinase [bacterium]